MNQKPTMDKPRHPYWGCPTCHTRESPPGNFRVYTCQTCGTEKRRYGEVTHIKMPAVPPLEGCVPFTDDELAAEPKSTITVITEYTEPHSGIFVCNWCGAHASSPTQVKHHESCAPPPLGDTPPDADDFQTLTAPFTTPTGVTFKCIIHEGCLRLVYWLTDEDPAIDDPWIIASVDTDGNVETFDDLPGVECAHHDKD